MRIKAIPANASKIPIQSKIPKGRLERIENIPFIKTMYAKYIAKFPIKGVFGPKRSNRATQASTKPSKKSKILIFYFFKIKNMRLRKCGKCGNYTFKEICSKCGNETISPHPPRFSPLDKYGEYRRALKLKK